MWSWVWRVIILLQTQSLLTAHKPGLYNCPTDLPHHWHADCVRVCVNTSLCLSAYAGYFVYTCLCVFSHWTSLNGTQFVRNFTSCRIHVQWLGAGGQGMPGSCDLQPEINPLFFQNQPHKTLSNYQPCTAFSYQNSPSLNCENLRIRTLTCQLDKGKYSKARQQNLHPKIW